MSTSSRSDTTDDSIFDIEELLQIEARCRELRREKDLLKETQSQSFDLIKRLELHVWKLNEARLDDKRKIQELEKELNNCHQEIDYLQDQLNAKNADVKYLEECVGSVEMKMVDFELLQEEVVTLREELEKSDSECNFYIQELGTKETQLQQSRLHIEKLEESIASAALEYQCEIESLRLEMMSLEQSCFEPEKSEEYCQEIAGLTMSLHEFQIQFEEAQKNIKNLENENKRMKDVLNAREKEARLFCQRVEEHFKGWMDCSKGSNSCGLSNVAAGEVSSCGTILRPLLSKLLKIGTSVKDLKGSDSGEKMSHELHKYKEQVKQVKEELKKEKLKAKEEAEDLAQEMAELRYQMTELLEEERKRRSCIEQASLQRISELEVQLQMEQRKSVGSVQRLCEA
ncbi:myosin-1-like [Chenopodium quinoa]|uniref:myosin-1-like n=1 Tax=Chenopodium quinoa TaxID=63459 RepID=UPI000B799748|nr:myosin-1-like [Chenopodium quinoa]